MKRITILLCAVFLGIACSKNEETELELLQNSSYVISINGQTYENKKVAEASATFAEGTDITTSKKFYAVVASLKDSNLQINGGPVVVEGITMPMEENSIGGESSGLVITLNNQLYVSISGTITIKKDNRYDEISVGNGAKTGKTEIQIEFSGSFRNQNAEEVPVSGSFYITK